MGWHVPGGVSICKPKGELTVLKTKIKHKLKNLIVDINYRIELYNNINNSFSDKEV